MNGEERVEIKRDGLNLCGRIARAGDKKSAVMIIFHGFGGDSGYEENDLYTLLTNKAVDCGVSVARFDFSGCGKSEGKFEDMDIFREMLDAIAILKYVSALPYATDIYLLGHSMGGVIAGMLAGLYPERVKKLILLAPAATLKTDALQGTCMGTEYDTWNIPETVFVGGQHHVGGHFFRIAKNLPIYELTSKYTGQALLIHGKSDEVVDYHASVEYHDCMPDSKLLIYENIDHIIEGKDKNSVFEEISKFLMES